MMPARHAPGTLHGSSWEDLVESGHITRGDALIAGRICRLSDEPADSDAALALVLAIRAVREGSTALDVHGAPGLLAEQDDDSVRATRGETTPPAAADETNETVRLDTLRALPTPHDWLSAITRSALVASGVMHVELDLVYLDRYHHDEVSIAERILAREATAPAALTGDTTPSISSLQLNDAQQAAVTSVLHRVTTVLTGGPGMGKTHTIGGVLTAMRDMSGPDLRIALAAPTGKAAARMSESLAEQGVDLTDAATTLHRLLGPLPGTSQRFRHDRRNPLPHDLVIVDEASMISLSMMARLLEALPDTTRLLLVGDPDQLASVEAGSVLRDVAEGLGPRRGVVQLTQEFRLATKRADLARAFRDGDPDAVLALMDETLADDGQSSGQHELRFVDVASASAGSDVPVPDLTALPEIVTHATQLRELALEERPHDVVAELGASRLLCAHRTGPYGTHRWNRLVEQALAERWPDVSHQDMYVGRPLLVTRNDYGLGLTNGDTGVVMRHGDRLVTVFAGTVDADGDAGGMSPWRLSDVETMHAMTVHKAQGSQADHVTVIVPPVGSRLLTREMLYTAVTRARRTLTIVGTREAVRTAVLSPARRSSGLARRLREQSGTSS